MRGFARDVGRALAARGQWLATHNLATITVNGNVIPMSEMMHSLRQSETERLAQGLSHVLDATYVAMVPGNRITGIYDRSIATPSGRIAVIRNGDTFSLAPWRPSLEQYRGQAVRGIVGPSRVNWALDRGRELVGRT
jgi:hypothetical protein